MRSSLITTARQLGDPAFKGVGGQAVFSD